MFCIFVYVRNRNILATVVLGLALGVLIGNVPSLSSFVENDRSPYIYNIDSPHDWRSEEGIKKLDHPSFFENGRLGINKYGGFDNFSVRSYRTRTVKASDDPITLGNLSIEGYVGDSSSSLRLLILDCESSPSKDENLEDICYGDNLVYSTGFIDDPGQVSFKKDVSNITAEGHLHLFLEVLTRSAAPVSDNKTYFNAVRLTRK